MQISRATAHFDQAFAETVLHHLDFQVAKSWYRIEDGTSKLMEAMEADIKVKPQMLKRVNKLSMGEAKDIILASVDGETEPRAYHTIFSTTTLGCLGQMDTSGLEFSDKQQLAIRGLHYDRSCKIAIKFSEAWWVKLGLPPAGGGSSTTDLPIRVTVFPSWIDGDASQPAVLICSYTWSLDATKFGSLIKSQSDPKANKQLLEMVLRNLVRLFSGRITYEALEKLVLDHHAYAWSHYEYTSGAFAYFGPGQFSNLWPALQQGAADGRLFFVGEAISPHHAWIAGALDSAYTQLVQFLCKLQRFDLVRKLKRSWFGGGVGNVPDGFEEKHAYYSAFLPL